MTSVAAAETIYPIAGQMARAVISAASCRTSQEEISHANY